MTTDKQIIIDGVDVSGCGFILERDGKIKCECSHATGFGVICDCESWKTCYYKQLKAKEQECERLKKQYNCYACDTCNGKEDYINMKRHCENAINSLHNKQRELEQLKAKMNN